MKKNASLLNKTAAVILLIFSVAFFLYGIYMVMYSVRYIQEYDSMAGTVDAARYVISACASYFGFALTLAAGALCLVNLNSVPYGRDAGYMEENFPGKDDTADILAADPFPPVAEIPVAAGSDLNNSSLVLQVRFGGATFLFMGDAGAEEERSLIQSGADVRCDVLAVGHHGSGSATGYVFLRQALPKYAVISVGAGNRYGHPAESTLSRLRDAGCTVYRTDQSGTITIVTDKNGKIRCPA